MTDFIQAVRDDPWSHAIAYRVADSWANGYAQALRDIYKATKNQEVGERLAALDHGLLVSEGYAQMTEASRRAEQELTLALAAMGPLNMKTLT